MKKYFDICSSDGLPCSCSIKGVGFGGCVKSLSGSVRVCARFSDVSLLERSIRERVECKGW